MSLLPNNLATPEWWVSLTPSRVARGVIVVLLVLLAFAALLWLRDVLALLFVGIVVATAVRPLYNRLAVGRIPRALAAFLAISTFVVAVAALLVAITPFLIVQGRTLVAQAPQYYVALRADLLEGRYPIMRSFGSRLPESLWSDVPADNAALLTQAVAWLPTLFTVAVSLLGAVLFGYYWLLYRERAVQALALLVPIDWRDRARDLWEQSEGKIGAFVRGQVLLGVSVGLLSFIGYWLAGIPYALLLAIIAGVMELVPVVGPILAAIPAITVGLSAGPDGALYAAIVAILVQQIENNILVPRIMDRTVGVSPVVSLIALVAFGALFGFTGAVLAIPLAAVLQVLLDAWLSPGSVPDPAGITGRDELALLRYQVQDLTQDLRGHLRSSEQTVDPDAEFLEEELEAIVGEIDALLATAATEQFTDPNPLIRERTAGQLP